jgi:hypothetical protein
VGLDIGYAEYDGGYVLCLPCNSRDDPDGPHPAQPASGGSEPPLALEDVVEIEPESDEPGEPEEGDWCTHDYATWWVCGETVLIVLDPQRWQASLRERMEQDQFWPNCWVISDHGNAHLLRLSE